MFAKLQALQRVGVPLVAVSTPDSAAFVRRAAMELSRHRNPDDSDLSRGTGAKIVWDVVQGVQPARVAMPTKEDKELYEPAYKAAADICGRYEDKLAGDPMAPLVEMVEWPEKTVLFVHLANRVVDKAPVIQQLLNLRDELKQNNRMIVLVDLHVSLPAELRNSVVSLDEPLPSDEVLRPIVEHTYDLVGLKSKNGTIDRSVSACRGLNVFAAEQYAALNIKPDGMDVDGLWEAKRKLVEETPGLTFWRGRDTFDDIGGCEAVKEDVSGTMTGRQAPELIVVVEEIEKAMAGVEGDNTGVSQDILQTMLNWMQEQAATGYLFCGVPGSGKSATAKAIGRQFNKPTLVVDIGAVKSSGVGDSETNWRNVLKTIDAVAGSQPGRTLWIGTSNGLRSVSSALLRRFKMGTYFFDLPSSEERGPIWNIHRSKLELSSDEELPDDNGWTGAEIATCCERAWRRNCSLVKASKSVIPYAVSQAAELARMRDEAAGKYNSAAYEGAYVKPGAKKGGKGRTIGLE